MLYVILCTDRAGVDDLRARTKPAHLAYLADHADIVVLGGVTMSDDGAVKTGSCWLVNVPDRASVDAFVENEPFVAAGIFESVSVRRMNKGQWNPAAAEGAESF